MIRAIQALAKRDGKVPGRLRFEASTGLGMHAWHGVYWARWSDAIAEAGLAPNLKTEAILEEVLLGAFLDLTIQLGHVPTDGELKLHGRTNEDFPHSRTFQVRFGRKTEMLKKVLILAIERGAPEKILDALRNATPDETDSDEGNEADSGPIYGYVYLLKSGRRYKIGKTTSPLKRIGQIGIELPERVEPIHTLETDDPSGIEAYWHNRFKDKRLNVEWFELTAEDVRAFKRRRKFM
ncbi:MAG: GIY-YIG nuclease family protein [Hyphomonadaceae bacterium]|nr:GIY-YIG nuclease family protein [Hyphomonadaceae bacterium]